MSKVSSGTVLKPSSEVSVALQWVHHPDGRSEFRVSGTKVFLSAAKAEQFKKDNDVYYDTEYEIVRAKVED